MTNTDTTDTNPVEDVFLGNANAMVKPTRKRATKTPAIEEAIEPEVQQEKSIIGGGVLRVTNTHHDDLLETATNTLLPSGQTVNVNLTVYGSRARVLANIKQLNSFFPDKIKVEGVN